MESLIGEIQDWSINLTNEQEKQLCCLSYYVVTETNPQWFRNGRRSTVNKESILNSMASRNHEKQDLILQRNCVE
jgi:hypothetical protein